MTLPGADTMKGGIIGVDFLRPILGVSLALDDRLPLLLVCPFVCPFPFNSIPRWKPFTRVDIAGDKLSGVVVMTVMGCRETR